MTVRPVPASITTGGVCAGAEAALSAEFEPELVASEELPEWLHPKSANKRPAASHRAIAGFRIFSPQYESEIGSKAGRPYSHILIRFGDYLNAGVWN